MRLACLFLVCFGVQAQTGVLTGAIVDQLDKAIPTAYVSLEGSGQKAETRTDELGRFRFENLPDGKYEVAMFASGWKTMMVESVLVSENHTTVLPPITLYVADFCSTNNMPRSLVFLPEGNSVVTGRLSVEKEGRVSALKDEVVQLYVAGSTIQTKTDQNGNFRLEAPPGTYSLLVDKYSVGAIRFLKGIEAHYWNHVVYRDRPVICE